MINSDSRLLLSLSHAVSLGPFAFFFFFTLEGNAFGKRELGSVTRKMWSNRVPSRTAHVGQSESRRGSERREE